jgi:hypothetical protein
MALQVPFCDTPEQSAGIAVVSGLLGGGLGAAAGLDLLAVVLLAGGLALVGEFAGHAARGDVHRWLGVAAADSDPAPGDAGR